MPHDNFLKSINSFAPCCASYFYFLLIEAPTSRTKTDQSRSALKIAQLWTGNIIGREPCMPLLHVDHPLLYNLAFTLIAS